MNCYYIIVLPQKQVQYARWSGKSIVTKVFYVTTGFCGYHIIKQKTEATFGCSSFVLKLRYKNDIHFWQALHVLFALYCITFLDEAANDEYQNKFQLIAQPLYNSFSEIQPFVSQSWHSVQIEEYNLVWLCMSCFLTKPKTEYKKMEDRDGYVSEEDQSLGTIGEVTVPE
ncbi:Hypothetical_protein [Hexamita inflata]|uniref:Hypothetical_protein n=1 Tax=Hexamita inflata TaxID=28002 RepID=A0AA86R1I1_9EUKA|nr:Hypothetical protein HINF_LOCUS55348 [Hexamita inflata]CAI9976818.1 Hypothetical protein HINF_LOCUS64463 [Hexamita inflata]